MEVPAWGPEPIGPLNAVRREPSVVKIAGSPTILQLALREGLLFSVKTGLSVLRDEVFLPIFLALQSLCPEQTNDKQLPA